MAATIPPSSPNQGILEAIRVSGSQVKLAERLNTTQPTVSRYLSNKVSVPVSVAIRLDKELAIPRAVTRPDVFGEEA